jgi:hypothetical protein
MRKSPIESYTPCLPNTRHPNNRAMSSSKAKCQHKSSKANRQINWYSMLMVNLSKVLAPKISSKLCPNKISGEALERSLKSQKIKNLRR